MKTKNHAALMHDIRSPTELVTTPVPPGGLTRLISRKKAILASDRCFSTHVAREISNFRA